KTATKAGAGTGGGHTPAIPARRMPSGSSRPRAPRGLVSRSWRTVASTRASVRRGPRLATAASNRRVTGSPSHEAPVRVTRPGAGGGEVGHHRGVTPRVVVEVGSEQRRGGVAVRMGGEAPVEVEGGAGRVDGGVVELVAPQLGAGRSEGRGDGAAGGAVAEVEAVAHGGGGGDDARHA